MCCAEPIRLDYRVVAWAGTRPLPTRLRAGGCKKCRRPLPCLRRMRARIIRCRRNREEATDTVRSETEMPANLTPEYKAAEAAFRKARDPRERLEWLREMLRTIPKHKGTDHLQGDIKRRIKELSEELERPQRGGARGGPALVIRPEGAAQIA